MNTIKEIFEEKKRLLAGNGASEEDIRMAEQRLGLTFSSEYRQYLKLYGSVAYGGHELTGITKSPRINVVNRTIEEKQKNPNIPYDFYVIEETDVEDILIWQSETEEIYASFPDGKVDKVAESFGEYIKKS